MAIKRGPLHYLHTSGHLAWDHLRPLRQNGETEACVLECVRLDSGRGGFWSQTETPLSSAVFNDLVFASGSGLTLIFRIHV